MTDTSLQASETQVQARRIQRAMRQLRSRARSGILIEGFGVLALSFSVFALGSFALDRLFRLDPLTRGVLLFAWLGWILYQLNKRMFRPLSTELDDRELVLAVERSDRDLAQRLISALQFGAALERGAYRDSSPALMRRLVAEVPQTLASVDLRSAIKRERVRTQGWVFLICLFLFMGVIASFPKGSGIWAQRSLLLASDVDWPRATQLQVLGAEKGYLLVPRGDEFTVEVDASGVIPDRVSIVYSRERGGRTTESMKQNTGESTFSFTFPGLLDPLSFHAEGGDGLSAEIEVRLVDRPLLEEMQLSLHYPSYMKRDPLIVGPGASELLVPEGSRLDLVARSSKPVHEAAFAVDREKVEAARIDQDQRTVRGSFLPESSGVLEIFLRDEQGMAQGEGRKVFLRVVPDKAPRVDVKRQGIGSMITPMARLPVDLRVRDDFGVRSIETLWGLGERADFGEGKDPGKVFHLGKSEGLDGFEAGVRLFEGRLVFDLLPLLKNTERLDDPGNRIRPGLLVFLRHRACDEYPNPDGEGPRASYGDRQTFRVVTPQELLHDLLRRQGQQRRELELLRDKHRRDSADFGDLASPKTTGDLGTQIRRKYRQLGRHQRHLARQVLSVAKKYQLILDEMRNNRLSEEGIVLRRTTQIVDPLGGLGVSAMPALANLLGAYTRSADADMREEASHQYGEILRMIDRVLRAMTELETFTTLLNQVRDLIEIQEKVMGEAKKRLDEDLSDFDLDPEEETKKKDGPEQSPKARKKN
ncbi:MAG: hypothetical protein CSA62_05435 [Planctomycetota bacterium]|nr:MAG: hypothetical protein CSA62_05435 [Planctomycetota bacterium]